MFFCKCQMRSICQIFAQKASSRARKSFQLERHPNSRNKQVLVADKNITSSTFVPLFRTIRHVSMIPVNSLEWGSKLCLKWNSAASNYFMHQCSTDWSIKELSRNKVTHCNGLFLFLCKAFEIDEEIVCQLANMGFDMEGCKKAVFHTKNAGKWQEQIWSELC